MAELLLKDEVYAVVGAAMVVYNELGPGFLEAVYHEAMEIELRLRRIPFVSHALLTVTYKDVVLNKRYEADLVVYDQLIVELKAMTQLTSVEQSQLLNYLKITGHQVGVLINFGHVSDLQWKRMVK